MSEIHAERRRGATIVFASGKGGVGKSNVVANLAALLGRGGRDVLVMDGDLGLANVDILLGLAPSLTMGNFLEGTHSLDDIAVEGPHGIRLIPAASGVAALTQLDEIQSSRLAAALAAAGRKADVTLIDAPAGISLAVTRLAGIADVTAVVTCPEPTALLDAYALIKVLDREKPGRRIALLVNNVREPHEGERVHRQIERISNRFLGRGVAFWGSLIHDEMLVRAVREQCPVIDLYPDARISRCFETLAMRLAAEIGMAPARRNTRAAPASLMASLPSLMETPEIVH